MSLSPFLFVVFCFLFFFVEADLRRLSQSVKSKTQKSEQGEKHTNKDCLFVYLGKKSKSSEWCFFSGNEIEFSFDVGFFFFLKGRIIVFIY